MRTAAAGASDKDLSGDLEFLQRLWKRVQHQAAEALAPEVVYTEMDLALRFTRDVFGEASSASGRRPGHVRQARRFPQEDVTAPGRRVSLYQDECRCSTQAGVDRR